MSHVCFTSEINPGSDHKSGHAANGLARLPPKQTFGMHRISRCPQGADIALSIERTLRAEGEQDLIQPIWNEFNTDLTSREAGKFLRRHFTEN